LAGEMHLLGHMCTGPTNHHFGSWRHPDSDAERVLKPERYEELARIYERGMFDGIFIVDHQCLPDLGPESPSGIARLGGQLQMLDPLLVLAIMARVTQHLGLAATVSTSLNNAFQIARSFASFEYEGKHVRTRDDLTTPTAPRDALCSCRRVRRNGAWPLPRAGPSACLPISMSPDGRRLSMPK